MVRVAITLELPLLDVFSHDVIVKLCRDDGFKSLSLRDESPHDILVNSLVVTLFDVWGRQVFVHAGDVLCKSHVLVLVLSI